MQIADAQREVRYAFLGGFMGQVVSGTLWLASAALATWVTTRAAILVLIVGGFFIFPITQVGLRLIGRSGRLDSRNALHGLGVQVAFVLPLCLPVVGAVAVHHLDWFYPAFMVVLGAHYLPFTFLYGMRMFVGLAALLVTGGVLIGLHGPDWFPLGAWVTAGVLYVFAVVGRLRVLGEEAGHRSEGA